MHNAYETPASANASRLAMVLALSVAVFVVELVGGVLFNSLALVADAGHVLSDVAGIGIALLAIRFARRPPTPRQTFGLHRMEVLAALANTAILFTVAGFVAVESWRRAWSPPDVLAGPMLAVAATGLVVNICSVVVLRSAAKTSLNMRGAYLEVLADAFGSLAVIAAAVLIGLTGLSIIDAIASALIAVLIVPRAWALLREALEVLVEATPRGTDLAFVRKHILEAPGVVGVHDLHAWTITSGMPIVSAHVVIAAGSEPRSALDRLCECLAECFDIEHSTLQIETEDRQHLESRVHS